LLIGRGRIRPAVTSKINNQQSSLINQCAFAAGRMKAMAMHRAKIRPGR
jgi:hypothetical protein